MQPVNTLEVGSLTRVALAAAAALALAGSSPAPPAGAQERTGPGLRAGAATSNITPPLGTSINGNMRDVLASHVNDELHARCLVLDDGAKRLALAVVDACMVPREVTEAARRAASEATSIPPGNILISATHSHSCGTLAPVFQSEPDPEYPRFVARRIADGIRRAANQLVPAVVGWGAGAVPEELNNRRWFMKPGTALVNPFGGADRVRMNPSPGSPDLLEPAGPVDPEVSVLSVATPEGRPLALVANYGLHYVGGVGPGHVSADYFGMFAQRVGKLLGGADQSPPFVGMMTNGTSGDVNNINFRTPRPRRQPYEQMGRVAERLAAEAARVHRGIRHTGDAKLGARTRELRLGVRKPSLEEIRTARETLAAAGAAPYSTTQAIYARETLLMAEYPETVPVTIQSLRIGGLGIHAIPCEVFADIGLELKRKSPLRPSFTISLANGYNGYLPTPEHHELGGYETWRARSSYLEVNASRLIVAGLLDLQAGLAQP